MPAAGRRGTVRNALDLYRLGSAVFVVIHFAFSEQVINSTVYLGLYVESLNCVLLFMLFVAAP